MTCPKCGHDEFKTTVMMYGGDSVEMQKCKKCGKIVQKN